MLTVAREEGALSLWKGLTPGGAGGLSAAGGAGVGRARAQAQCLATATPGARGGLHIFVSPSPSLSSACCARVPAGIHRQVLLGGLRIATYEPIK